MSTDSQQKKKIMQKLYINRKRISQNFSLIKCERLLKDQKANQKSLPWLVSYTETYQRI